MAQTGGGGVGGIGGGTIDASGRRKNSVAFGVPHSPRSTANAITSWSSDASAPGPPASARGSAPSVTRPSSTVAMIRATLLPSHSA